MTAPTPPETVERIRQMYDDGLTQYQIAAALHSHQVTISKVMRRHSIPRRPNGNGNLTDSERLARILDRCTETADGCWEWTGATSSDGYGRVRYRGSVEATHRVVYELMVALIPAGLDLDHLCLHRPCCNPSHLEPVTKAVNGSRSRENQMAP